MVVVTGQYPFGNGHLLPAGPLRESRKRLASIDVIVAAGSDILPKAQHYEVVPTCLVQLTTGRRYDLRAFKDQTVHAVAGIARPERFFNLLRTLGYTDLTEHSFPDHHDFKASDLMFGDDALIIMTEKDATKCQHWNDSRLWMLIIDARFSIALQEQIFNLLAGHAR